MKVGVISDTHNMLRPEAVRRLSGCGLIIHAGDICSPAVLDSLEKIAPTVAVRGNCDTGGWAERLPLTRTLELADGKVLVVHNIETLPESLDPTAYRMIVFGHSHKPTLEHRGGTLYLNPGAAGPRRFSLPASIAIVTIEGGRLLPELITL